MVSLFYINKSHIYRIVIQRRILLMRIFRKFDPPKHTFNQLESLRNKAFICLNKIIACIFFFYSIIAVVSFVIRSSNEFYFTGSVLTYICSRQLKKNSVGIYILESLQEGEIKKRKYINVTEEYIVNDERKDIIIGLDQIKVEVFSLVQGYCIGVLPVVAP